MIEKLHIIEIAKSSSNHAAARQFGISRKNIINWRKQEAALRDANEEMKRLPGGGRKRAGTRF